MTVDISRNWITGYLKGWDNYGYLKGWDNCRYLKGWDNYGYLESFKC